MPQITIWIRDELYDFIREQIKKQKLDNKSVYIRKLVLEDYKKKGVFDCRQLN